MSIGSRLLCRLVSLEAFVYMRFCNVSSGGASTKVIGRSQTLSVEVGITTVLSCTVYECQELVFTPETARCLGILRVPIERLAERYSSGIFQQWFNLDTRTDPRMPAGDPQQLVSKFEQAYTDAVADVYQPKICISVIGTAFEVQRGGRQSCSIFVLPLGDEEDRALRAAAPGRAHVLLPAAVGQGDLRQASAGRAGARAGEVARDLPRRVMKRPASAC